MTGYSLSLAFPAAVYFMFLGLSFTFLTLQSDTMPFARLASKGCIYVSLLATSRFSRFNLSHVLIYASILYLH